MMKPEGFIGIKDIINSEGVNKFPSNRFDTSINPLYSILCILLTFVGHLIGFVNGILMMINGLITEICQFKFPVKITFQYCIAIAGDGVCNKAYKDRCKQYYNGGNCNGTCNKCRCNMVQVMEEASRVYSKSRVEMFIWGYNMSKL